MSIGFKKHSDKASALLIPSLLVCSILSATPSSADQWESLTQTNRFHVSIKQDSVQSTTDDIRTIWLRFIPFGTRQRLEASKKYSQKKYRQHLEKYEIDCIEQIATLNQIDFLGKNGKKIGELININAPDAIIPGSVLESAALLVCPKQKPVETEEPFLQENFPEMDTSVHQDPKPSENYQQKINAAKAKTISDPTSFSTWAELGNVYYDADMPRESIDAYEHALKIKPDSIEVLNDQAAMYKRIGEFQNALKNHEKALSLDPKNLESLYLAGYIYAIELNRIKEAIPLWQRYIAINSSSETSKQIKQYIDKYGK